MWSHGKDFNKKFFPKQMTLNSLCPEIISYCVWDNSSITLAKKWVGGVKKWQFLLDLYADVGKDVFKTI